MTPSQLCNDRIHTRSPGDTMLRSSCSFLVRRLSLCFVLVSIVSCALVFFFSSRRRHTRYWRDWSSDVCLPISEELLARIVNASSQPGDLVLDAFAGSGTTL